MGGRGEKERRTGGQGADGQTARRREADGQTRGGWADGRTARRIEADGWTSGRADKSGRGTD